MTYYQLINYLILKVSDEITSEKFLKCFEESKVIARQIRDSNREIFTSLTYHDVLEDACVNFYLQNESLREDTFEFYYFGEQNLDKLIETNYLFK